MRRFSRITPRNNIIKSVNKGIQIFIIIKHLSFNKVDKRLSILISIKNIKGQ